MWKVKKMSKRHKKNNNHNKNQQPQSDRGRGPQQSNFKDNQRNDRPQGGASDNRNRDYNERKNLDKDHSKPTVGQNNPLSSSTKGLTPVPSVMTPTRQIYKKQVQVKSANLKTKKYGVLFFDTLQSARSDLAKLKESAANFDQLNIVIKAEPTVDDQDLLSIGKVFSGAAWTLIHERRVQDGWYEQPRD